VIYAVCRSAHVAAAMFCFSHRALRPFNPLVYENVWMIAYFGDITVKNIYQSTHKMAAKASWHRNYVTVTLCIAAL